MREFIAQIDRAAWLRFFVGLGGLAASFACAVLSTALRESGYAIPAAIVASVSLLTAGCVGLYTVPYLAKRVVRERWLDAFEYEITKEGIVYLAAVLVITIAALNTGNNLLFIIISAMLAAVVISGLASAFMLRRVSVSLSMPDLIFAQQGCVARIRLMNRRRVPVFSLHVSTSEKPKGKLRWEPAEFYFPPWRSRDKASFVIKDRRLRRELSEMSEDSPMIAPLYFPLLLKNSSANADAELTFLKRGVFHHRALAISTRFPFSFVKKTRRVSTDEEVIVFPAIHPVERLIAEMPALSGVFDSVLRGQGNDLYRIRDHVAGESARNVDWKASARSGSLMIREFTKDDDQRLSIIFDNPGVGSIGDREYENMISACASLTWLLRDRVHLEFVAPGFDGSDTLEFLSYLAVVTRSPRIEGLHVSELPSDCHSVIFTADEWDHTPNCTIFSF